MDEAELVRRVRLGEAQAWSELVRNYERLVYAIPRRMGLSQADVEEVFQNTWLLVYEHVRHVRDASKLRSWISTTTMRESWRLHRGARPQEGVDGLELATPESGPGDHVAALELRAEVQRGLESLRAPCGELLTLLFFEEDRPAYADVAKRLGMPIGSLGPTRARCLGDLARYLEQRGLQDFPESVLGS